MVRHPGHARAVTRKWVAVTSRCSLPACEEALFLPRHRNRAPYGALGRPRTCISPQEAGRLSLDDQRIDCKPPKRPAPSREDFSAGPPAAHTRPHTRAATRPGRGNNSSRRAGHTPSRLAHRPGDTTPPPFPVVSVRVRTVRCATGVTPRTSLPGRLRAHLPVGRLRRLRFRPQAGGPDRLTAGQACACRGAVAFRDAAWCAGVPEPAASRRRSHREAASRRPAKTARRRADTHICRLPGNCQPVQAVDAAHSRMPAR